MIGLCFGEFMEGEACDDVVGDDGFEWDGVIASSSLMDYIYIYCDLELFEIEYYM